MRGAGVEVIGRDEELALIRGFLQDADPRVVVLEGEPGIGKTILWLAGVEQARERGDRVLFARLARVEVTLALTGLGDLLAGAPPESFELLPEPQRQALAAALGEQDAYPDESDGRVLAVAFLNLLRVLAQDAPVVLAIDDLQWLDRASGTVVVHAIRRLGEANVRMLASCRAEPGAPLPFDLSRALTDEALRRLTLGPLSEGAIRRLLHRRLDLSLTRVEAHALHAAARGNPFHALELGRVGLERDEAGIAPEHRNLPGLVRARLRALPRSTRDALLYVAALPDPNLRVLMRVGVRDQLEPAIEGGVVELDAERLRFTHPLLASTVWNAAGTRRRREVHLALADAVEDLEQRAGQLALATDGTDAKVAALLEEAAASAQARGAPAAAADLLERARQLTPEDDLERWARLTAVAASLHMEVGPVERTTELVAEALSRLPPGPERADILIARGAMQPQPSELCLQAIAEAGETETAVRARIVRSAQLAFAGSWRESVEAGEEAVSLARRLGLPGLLGASLAAVCWSKLMDSRPDATATLAEALALERELGGLPIGVRDVAPQYWMGVTAYWRDDPESARPVLERLLEQTSERGDEAGSVRAGGTLAGVELNAGRWARARALAEEAWELATMLSYSHGAACCLVIRSRIAASEGELGQARAMAERALPVFEAAGDALWSTLLHSTMLLVELSEGDAAAALARAEAISAAFPDGRESLWTYHQGDELEARVLAGDHEGAFARVEALRAAGKELGLPRFLAWAERGEALVREARGDLEGAQAAAELALAQHERLPLRFERARTLLVFGRILRRRTQRRAARAILGEALAEFEELGARQFAGLARVELGHVGGRAPAGGGVLTTTEERVARLVAAGLTNKEVAARLFVTVSAVEATLTRVYGKLGISSRSQLARVRPELAASDPEPSPGNGVAGS